MNVNIGSKRTSKRNKKQMSRVNVAKHEQVKTDDCSIFNQHLSNCL
uniref:Uncharacterized protein n=1 Tax=Meloidogyne hapla TaxID=6305 RepID=A0A1I8BH09_MELHA